MKPFFLDLFSLKLRAFNILFVFLVSCYFSVVIYLNGEFVFAFLFLAICLSGIYIFTNPKFYALRYVYPGIIAVFVFVVFPMLYTIGISFSNYSGANLLSQERVKEHHLAKTYNQDQTSYNFKIYQENGSYRLILNQNGNLFYESSLLDLKSAKQIKEKNIAKTDLKYTNQKLNLKKIKTIPNQKHLAIRDIIALRTHLGALKFSLNNDLLSMTSLRKFAPVSELYKKIKTLNINTKEGEQIYIKDALKNTITQEIIAPNYETGFYQKINKSGEFYEQNIAPGFKVNVGFENYINIIKDKGMQEPFLKIFVWTLIFASLSVFLTFAIGVVLASLVQWEHLRFKGVYRVLLILPYAVPAFISILIFKGLFNQNFGEINLLLEGLFGIKPDWTTNPFLAKLMILIVNTWLGYPYMMILCMGLLKSISDDLYEASSMDGAGFIYNFFYITLPLLIKPMLPLLIASFAFNFNNFVLISLLTEGRPDIIGASTPAGETDLLVSYTYRIAFEAGGGTDYALAASISTVIFILVGLLAYLNLKVTKVKV